LDDGPKKEIEMSKQLEGKRIAILATDGFEQVELTEPKKNLEAEGAKVTVLSIKPGEGGKAGEIKGWDKTDWGKTVKVDGLVYDASVDQFDALVLPGGQINPDKLRVDKDAVAFVKKFAESGKTVAAICHGPWTLIEAVVVKGKTMTSWPSVSTDLKNAGAQWVDKEVVVDGNFITSRKPEDIPAFSKAIVESVSKGVRELAHA
jgi:protease I